MPTPDEDNGADSILPAYYKQTATAYGHSLTAIEGQLRELVWRCRICGEIRATTDVFQEVECDG